MKNWKMTYGEKEYSLAFFLKKGKLANGKLPKGQTLQCNSDASQFTQFSSKNRGASP